MRTTGIYVLHHARFGALKVGVGKESRVKTLVGDGWEKVVHLGPFPSSQSLTIEGHVLNCLREVHPGSFLSSCQMPHGGWTETFPDTIDLQQVFEYLKDAGVTEEDLVKEYDQDREISVSREPSGLITLDAQGRARLKDLAEGRTVYAASVDRKGVITLVPALIVTDEEKYLRNRIQQILKERGITGTLAQDFTWEALAALVPVNNEAPPPHVEADVIEAVKSPLRAGSGISVEAFLAQIQEEDQ